MTKSETPSSVLDGALAGVLEGVGRVAGCLCQRGWAEAGAGNLSVDVTDCLASSTTQANEGRVVVSDAPVPHLAGRSLLVTAAGGRFRSIERDPVRGTLVVRVTDDGASARIVWDHSGGQATPTSELPTHLMVHECLRKAGSAQLAVLHTHPTDLIALNHTQIGADQTTLNGALQSMLPEVKLYIPEGVALVPYQQPGSKLLAAATARVVESFRVAVWDKHGCLATGGDVEEAFDLIDVADKASRIYLRACAAGGTPRGLTDDEIADL